MSRAQLAISYLMCVCDRARERVNDFLSSLVVRRRPGSGMVSMLLMVMPSFRID